MLGLAVVMIKLVVVIQVFELDSENMQLTLDDGHKLVLRKSVPSYDYYLTLVKKSVSKHRPVGVGIRNDIVEKVIPADQDIVREITQEVHGQSKVWLLGHDGTYLLDSSVPDADRIRRVLFNSKETQSRIWFVATLPELRIMDANRFSEPSTK
jgi:hypothetical protein